VKHVGTYGRVLPVSVERLYENALDWAHLPYVHSDSFGAITPVDSDVDGWRARVRTPTEPADEFEIELRLDRASRRWITKTLAGRNAGSEIWTYAFPIAPRRTDIVVDFFSPDVPDDDGARIGNAFLRLYTRLYDQDEAMMLERQRQLDTRIDSRRFPEPLVLGRRDEIALPRTVVFNAKAWVIADVQGTLRAYAARCPHMLGPLGVAPLDATEVQCPWHGFRFDVVTGKCTSGQHYELAPAPRVVVDAQDRIVIQRDRLIE
jgi:nitrite reductase/ring-hydroxylating ferredoxin subunit